MYKHIFVIDDEKIQADGLAKQLNERMGGNGYVFEPLSGEHEIMQAVSDRFCSLAIVDLRMDDYPFNGFGNMPPYLGKQSSGEGYYRVGMAAGVF